MQLSEITTEKSGKGMRVGMVPHNVVFFYRGEYYVRCRSRVFTCEESNQCTVWDPPDSHVLCVWFPIEQEESDVPIEVIMLKKDETVTPLGLVSEICYTRR